MKIVTAEEFLTLLNDYTIYSERETRSSEDIWSETKIAHYTEGKDLSWRSVDLEVHDEANDELSMIGAGWDETWGFEIPKIPLDQYWDARHSTKEIRPEYSGTTHFLVWEKADIEALIATLQKALEVAQ